MNVTADWLLDCFSCSITCLDRL